MERWFGSLPGCRLRASFVGVLAAVLLSFCHGGESGRPHGSVCTYSADCEQGLACEFGRCRLECTTDDECPDGLCVAVTDDVEYRVCTFLPNELDCTRGEGCAAPLICGDDGRCRNSCSDEFPCGGGRVCIIDLCVDLEGEIRAFSEASFDDFIDGSFPTSLANAYVSSDGAVRTHGATDLDGDGYADLPFSNSWDGATRHVPSYIYWGSEQRFDPWDRAELPGMGASAVATADLDADGFVDVVLVNERDDDGDASIQSYVYWGGEEGFSTDSRSELTTDGARGASIADLDRDGYLDLVFANGGPASACSATDSVIFWGSADGFSDSSRSGLPTIGAMAVEIADLDDDGNLDIVFVCARCPDTEEAGALIYWGSSEGFEPSNRQLLTVPDARECAIADVDSDGRLDLVVTNAAGDTETATGFVVFRGRAEGFDQALAENVEVEAAAGAAIADLDRDGYLDAVISDGVAGPPAGERSHIFWGSEEGFVESLALPSTGAIGSRVLFLDDDWFYDIVFANAGEEFPGDSYVYWGSVYDFREEDLSSLPTLGASAGVTRDVGNTHDRGADEHYVSSIFDLGDNSRLARVAWEAETPLDDTSVRFRLRSADSTETLAEAPWLGPTSEEDWYDGTVFEVSLEHTDHRYLQYRVALTSSTHRADVALHSVTIAYVID